MNEIATMKKTETNAMLFDDTIFSQLERIAIMMTSGQVMVPKHLKAKGDCFAVVMQAAQWGMNPYAVAQKTFLVSGTLGYEAQLVNAVISTSTAIKGRFHYEYGGEWEKIEGRTGGRKQIPDKFNNGAMKWIDVKGWADKEEAGLWIKVGAIISGEDNITWSEKIFMAPITTRNSPLWATDPKQQMAYLAVKKWARMYTPGVILGVYTPDELNERDITPVAFDDLETNDKLEAHKRKVSAGKKKGAVIEGTSEEVLTSQAPSGTEEKEKDEPKEKAITLKEFKIKISRTVTPADLKLRQAEVKLMTGDSRKKAATIFKARLAELKEASEPANNQDRQENKSTVMDEPYRLLNLAKSSDDIDVAVDAVMKLNADGVLSPEEIVLFDKVSQEKYDEVTKEE